MYCIYWMLTENIICQLPLAKNSFSVGLQNPSLVKPSPDTSLPIYYLMCPLLILSSLHLSTSHFPNHPSPLSTLPGFPPMWSLLVLLSLPPFSLLSHPARHKAIKEHSEKPSTLVCLPCCPHLPKIPTTEPR